MVLPRNTHNTITLQFNNVEREIYEAIRERCVRAINNMARNEDLEKKFPVVIYMFQRLRQMVSHIFQVQESIEREFELEQIKYLRSDNTTTDAENDMIKGLERIIADRDLVATNDDVTSNHSGSQQAEHPNASTSPPYQPQAGVQTTVNDDSQGGEDDQDEADVQPAPGEGSSKPKKKKAPSIVPNFVKKLRELRQKSKWTELRDNVLCQLCGGPAENPHVTSCFHLYCKECLLSLQLEAADKDLDRAQCAKCGHLWERSEFCGGLKELEVRDLSSTVFQEDESNKSKARPKQVTMKYVDSDNKLVLSSKVAAVKRQLAEWIGQDPHAKIIVFSEWHMVYAPLIIAPETQPLTVEQDAPHWPCLPAGALGLMSCEFFWFSVLCRTSDRSLVQRTDFSQTARSSPCRICSRSLYQGDGGVSQVWWHWSVPRAWEILSISH